ncbi:hypothetical protein JTE90_026679 [Oedothorax gibbosus]|uniref:Apple domain-containing protein n=1 Tax=Oedothorax gibbosus TaxID=931172 RepID=A0AAV6V0J5_9ARAC|nr:hypothetical protein JTE90_026679 [Oedothorax gibbosus]
MTIIILSLFSVLGLSELASSGIADQFKYSLDIRDKMDPVWIRSDLSPVSRIECAHLCFKQSCKYFGYSEGRHCHLLEDSVDEEQCADGECSSPGMKIYKLREIEQPTTTTEEITTTKEPTTTTTEKPTTTTTEEPTTTTEEPTTTTEKPTTTTQEPTTTTENPTTTTEEPTTTTTEKPTTTTTEATTTTEEPTTTTAESPTTTTTEMTTTTTTEEPSTTTTTEQPTTTTTLATTTEGDTTTKDPWSCAPGDGGMSVNASCLDTQLLNALGSRSPFFGDVLSPKCYDFNENIYDASKEEVKRFLSLDGGLTLNAKCSGDTDVIYKWNLCVMKQNVKALTIHCAPVKDSGRIEKVFNRSSEKWKDALTDCDQKAGYQAIYMEPAPTAPITRVTHQCVLFTVSNTPVDDVAGNKPATG